MKPKTWSHPKFALLKRQLKVGACTAAGILEGLWHLSATFDDTSGTVGYSSRQFAAWCEYEGDADLLAVLADCGFLDTTESGGYRVHDWLEHRPKYVSDRIRLRERRDTSATVGEQSATVGEQSATRREQSPPSDSDSDSAVQKESERSRELGNSKPGPGRKPSSLDEARAYGREHARTKKLTVTDDVLEAFWDFYEANGWVQGKNKPLRNWQSAMRQWLRRDQNGEFAGSASKPEKTNSDYVTEALAKAAALREADDEERRRAMD